MELHRLSENEQAFVECFSRFVNGQMGSAAKVGNALADDHRYLINEKGKVVFAFLERLANDYQKGRYDQRDECNLTILWDKDGSRYQRGKGLHIYVDGKEVGHADTLTRVFCENVL